MSKPLSEQMQKLAARYEKATGKKFCGKTNAQKIRAMSDEELCDLLDEWWCMGANNDERLSYADERLAWLQQPAEEDDHDERKENEHV